MPLRAPVPGHGRSAQARSTRPPGRRGRHLPPPRPADRGRRPGSAGRPGQCLQQPGHHGQRHHRRLVDDHHVERQPVVPVVPEPVAAAGHPAQQPVQRRRRQRGKPCRSRSAKERASACTADCSRAAAFPVGAARATRSGGAVGPAAPPAPARRWWSSRFPGPPPSTVVHPVAATCAASRCWSASCRGTTAADRRPAPTVHHRRWLGVSGQQIPAGLFLLPAVPVQVEQAVFPAQRLAGARPAGWLHTDGHPGVRFRPRQLGVDLATARRTCDRSTHTDPLRTPRTANAIASRTGSSGSAPSSASRWRRARPRRTARRPVEAAQMHRVAPRPVGHRKGLRDRRPRRTPRPSAGRSGASRQSSVPS